MAALSTACHTLQGPSTTLTQPVATRRGGVFRSHRALGLVPRASGQEVHHQQHKGETLTGVVFQPFEEVAPVLHNTSTQGELNSPEPQHSFARMNYAQEAEAAVNEQINVELNISYVYQSMAAYFDRDNVSLPGLARYFKEESLEERGHAQKLINFQNTRGGRVKLNAMASPVSDFFEEEKGDALYAMELALSLEKLNFDKLLALWHVGERFGDAQMTHFLDGMLEDQVRDIKKAADYVVVQCDTCFYNKSVNRPIYHFKLCVNHPYPAVAQLRRVGKGLGVWQWDQQLYEGEIHAHTA